MNEMLGMYKQVAELFCERINKIFESEQTLEAEFKRNFENLPFSRTDHWQAILYRVFRDCWMEKGPAVKAEPTGYDRLAVLKQLCPMLDYNLFSQVLLNLQTYNGLAYQTADAEKEIEHLKSAWAEKQYKLDPFAPKVKMLKIAATAEEQEFNTVLSAIRSLRIIANFTPMISFRVSPKGSTPAFADSNNVSMLGMGADKYLKLLSSLEAYYLIWEPGRFISAQQMGDATPEGIRFFAQGIPYPFVSKSGGEILQEVLFARNLMYTIFRAIDVTSTNLILLPRMNSLLVVTDKSNVTVKQLLKNLEEYYPTLKVQIGSRIRSVEQEHPISRVPDPPVWAMNAAKQIFGQLPLSQFDGTKDMLDPISAARIIEKEWEIFYAERISVEH